MIAKTPPSFFKRMIGPSTACVAMATSLSVRFPIRPVRPVFPGVSFEPPIVDNGRASSIRTAQEIGNRAVFNHLQCPRFLSIFGGCEMEPQPGAGEALLSGLN